MCLSVNTCAGTPGGQKEAWDPLDLKLQSVVIQAVWELGKELSPPPPGRAGGILNHEPPLQPLKLPLASDHVNIKVADTWRSLAFPQITLPSAT